MKQILFACAVAAVFLVAACGGGGGGGGGNPPSASGAFTNSVSDIIANTSETAEPVNIDGIADAGSETEQAGNV